MKRIDVYLSEDKIIEYNILAINLIQVKKGDKAEVLSKSKINDVVEVCKEIKGDVYDKAVFLLINNQVLGVNDDPEQARIMIGIRENFYKDEELKEWLKYGKIRKFER